MLETEGSNKRFSQHLLKLFKEDETRLDVFAMRWDVSPMLPVLFAARFIQSVNVIKATTTVKVPVFYDMLFIT